MDEIQRRHHCHEQAYEQKQGFCLLEEQKGHYLEQDFYWGCKQNCDQFVPHEQLFQVTRDA